MEGITWNEFALISIYQKFYEAPAWKPNSVLHPCPVKHELNFHDKDTHFYRFQDSQFGLNHIANDSEDELQEALSLLSQLGPDALLTMILRKWQVCLVTVELLKCI